MWTRFVLKPFWVRGSASAGVYAAFKALDWSVRGLAVDPHESWLVPLAGYVAGSVIVGFLAAVFTDNSHRTFVYTLAGLDHAQRSAAVDASFRGPVPVDAAVRDAAIRVAQRRLRSVLSWRALWLVLFCLAVLSAGARQARAVIFGTRPPSGWNTHDWISLAVGLAVVLCFTVAAWYVSLSVKHRLQTLSQTSDLSANAMGDAG